MVCWKSFLPSISRPRWISQLNNDISKIDKDYGVIYAGNPKVLKKYVQVYTAQFNLWGIV